MALSDEQRANRQNHNLEGVARLKRDVEVAQAQSEMDAISTRLAREFPKSDGRWEAVVIPMQEAIVGNSRTMLLMLLGAGGLVLLIACANVGNLFFTRTLNRRREIAIRSALGAGRGRVFQQLLIEALLLAIIGGALGLLVAHVTLTAASSLIANHVPRASEISIDAHVLLFVVTASMLAGMLAGTLPALRAGRSDLNAALKEGGRSNGAIGVGTRRVLIVCDPDDGAGHRLETDVAAVQRAAARNLCGGGAAARLGRHLRRAFLHRARAQPRDRDQDCAGCANGRRASTCHRGGDVANARRHRRRGDGRARIR